MNNKFAKFKIDVTVEDNSSVVTIVMERENGFEQFELEKILEHFSGISSRINNILSDDDIKENAELAKTSHKGIVAIPIAHEE